MSVLTELVGMTASAILGGVIGYGFSMIGYGINTWQYWTIAIPAAFVVGAAVSRLA